MFLKSILVWTALTSFVVTNKPATSLHSLEVQADYESSFSSILENNESLQDVTISEYDPLFRRVSEELGNDWRLMSAIAYHESRFTPDIKSHVGAQGIMQVMPRVASQFNVTAEQLADVETNIKVGNMVYNKIGEALRLPSNISAENRLKLTLASYNGGVGHIRDARRLAAAFGEDPNSWEVVARYLRLKNESTYYQNSVVKCGRFKGAKETINYVDNVVGHYQEYCLLASR